MKDQTMIWLRLCLDMTSDFWDAFFLWCDTYLMDIIIIIDIFVSLEKYIYIYIVSKPLGKALAQ